MNSGSGFQYPGMSDGGYYGQYGAPRLPPPPLPHPQPHHQPQPHPHHQAQAGYPRYAQRSPPQPQHQPSSPSYSLRIEQGPERAKLVGKDKAKDRKPIDPPPIIRCVHSDLQSSFNPYLFCSVTLWDEEKDEPKKSDNSALPLLIGSTVSSAHRLKSLNNDEGTFFVFGDIAPGVQGKARLHFVMFQLHQDKIVPHATITSERFDVSNAKDWDGVKESTVLSRTFADQGVKLRLRKESRNGRRTLPPSYPPMAQVTQAPMLLPQPSALPSALPSAQSYDYDDDSERGSKRQRLAYSGSTYQSYPQSSQMGMAPYPSYATQDPQAYSSQTQGYTSQAQGYTSQTPLQYSNPNTTAQVYSPQYGYGRAQTQQYYSPQYGAPSRGHEGYGGGSGMSWPRSMSK